MYLYKRFIEAPILDSKLTAQRNNENYLKSFPEGGIFKLLLTDFAREKRNSVA